MLVKNKYVLALVLSFAILFSSTAVAFLCSDYETLIKEIMTEWQSSEESPRTTVKWREEPEGNFFSEFHESTSASSGVEVEFSRYYIDYLKFFIFLASRLAQEVSVRALEHLAANYISIVFLFIVVIALLKRKSVVRILRR